jgi:hypothetical protein
VLIDRLTDLLRSHRFLVSEERALQDAIELLLAAAADDLMLLPTRETILAPGERIDFTVFHGFRRKIIGIEVKVDGSKADVARQLMRYVPYVDGLVLVTTRARHVGLPATLGGKPLRVVRLENAF